MTTQRQSDPNVPMSAGSLVALHDAQGVLNGLNLLGLGTDDEKAQGLGSVFSGPPQTVALIEAGATAASKWWASGLSAAVTVAWVGLRAFWGNLPDPAREVLLWGASIATAAALLSVGMIMAADIRGRALAAKATIEARTRVAEVLLHSLRRSGGEGASHGSASSAATSPSNGQTDGAAAEHAYVLPSPLPFAITTLPAADERGWEAILVTTDGDSAARYLLWKGDRARWARQDELTYMGH